MRILLLSCVLVLAGCGFKQEPVLSHGKTASYWIDTLKSPNPKERKKAVEALGHIGPADSAAIPALIETVKDGDPLVRGHAILALLNISHS